MAIANLQHYLFSSYSAVLCEGVTHCGHDGDGEQNRAVQLKISDPVISCVIAVINSCQDKAAEGMDII